MAPTDSSSAIRAPSAQPRIGLYLYFRPSLGGGERYLLTAASALRVVGTVDFLCPYDTDLATFERAFGLDLADIRFVRYQPSPLRTARTIASRRPYDLFFSLDNHLSPVQISLGRKGILHLQSPPYAPKVDRPWRSWLKLRSYNVVVCNSEYTRQWALRHGTSGLPVRVLYPPIEVDLYRPLPKRRLILSVGRFFVGRHEKKHAIQIDAFRNLVSAGLSGWELCLAGSIRDHEPEHRAYLDELRRLANGLPVRFVVNASLAEIQRLYGEASLYWHATGHGVDGERYPQFLEHFGMSIVEAMAAGAIPLVIAKGGPLEIVHHGDDGFSWETVEELVTRTRELAGAAENDLAPLRRSAADSAKRFSRARFDTEVRALARELAGD